MPTLFYHKTFRYWLGAVMFGIVSVVLMGIGIYLFAKNELNTDATVVLSFWLVICLPCSIFCISRIIIYQTPTVAFYREGIRIRLATNDSVLPLYRNEVERWFYVFLCLTHIVLLFELLSMVWNILTLKIWSVKIYYVPWENVPCITWQEFQSEGLLGNSWIPSVIVPNHNRNDLSLPKIENNVYNYSSEKVFETIGYWGWNGDVRLELPSWQAELDEIDFIKLFDGLDEKIL